MCGIAGIYMGRALGADEQPGLEHAVGRMQTRLHARGPDQRGRYCDAECGLVLGHTRLSVLDLSQAGRQPMWSHCGRYAIVYNGEIYNYTEIRRSLDCSQGRGFATGTDTEVLLEAIAERGVEGALRTCQGMFAFALWDRIERTLTLARDPLGKKPLYYRLRDGGIAFASELGALAEADREPWPIDLDGLGVYLALGYVTQDAPIYQGVGSVPVGTLLTFLPPAPGDHRAGVSQSVPTRHFDLFALAEEALYTGATLERGHLDRDLEGALRRAVVNRTRADVPLGLLLSGGVDSSLIAALAAEKALPITAFTMGFEDDTYDEREHAAAIAAHFGLPHRTRTVTAADARRTAQECIERFDEPLADQSLIPTLMLSEMVGADVKVCLSGDGGDELFGGYGKYRLFDRMQQAIERLPGGVRRGFARLASPTAVGALARWPKSFHGQRAFKAIQGMRDLDALGRMALTRSPMINRYVRDEARARVAAAQARIPGDATRGSLAHLADMTSTSTLLQLLDQAIYLTDDILKKMDRASMARSLEVRNPLLDRDVVAISWRLKNEPLDQPKAPLRRSLERHLPRALWERPKQGFSPPMANWLTGALRPWAEEQLDRTCSRFDDVLDRDRIFSEWTRCMNRGMVKMQAQEFWTLIMLNCVRRP